MDFRLCSCCFKSKGNYLNCLQDLPDGENISTIIKFHLQLDIVDSNILPKFVCTECWTIILNFHVFFRAVERAEIAFLQTKLKNGEIRERIRKKYQILNRKNSNRRKDSNTKSDVSNDQYLSIQMCSEDDNNSENDSHTQDPSDQHVESKEEQEKEFKRCPLKKSENRKRSINADSDFENESYGRENTEIGPILRDKDKEDDLISKYFNLNCTICSEKFNLALELHKHWKSVHQMHPPSLTCKCGRKYSRPYEMRDHVHYHLSPNAFRCCECNKTFQSKRKLVDHKNVHINKKIGKFTCDTCNACFKDHFSVRRHIHRSHSNRKLYCELCDEIFKSHNSFENHMSNIHNSLKFECILCGAKLETNTSLIYHLSKHENQTKS